MTAIVTDPKKLEAFVVYLQSLARRQFPHDEITLVLKDGKISAGILVRSSDRDAKWERLGNIHGFLHGLLAAPTLFSKLDIQCAVYLAQPHKPAGKLPD
jgi:hypothetical protein